MSLKIQYQGTLFSWLASLFNSLCAEHKIWCILLPGIKIMRKIHLMLSTTENNLINDFLNFCQYREITDLPSSASVEWGVDCLLFEGHVLTKQELVRVLAACATRQDDLTVSFDFEGCGCINQPLKKTQGLAQILRDSCQSYWCSGMIQRESADPFMLLSQWVEAEQQEGESSHDIRSMHAQWALCWCPKLYLFWGH